MLEDNFFNNDAENVAKKLLGKLICVNSRNGWRYARIIETEAYYIHEKASHASLGFTDKRKPLFMSAGTIYMYHSRAGTSFNVSCKGEGNAVLIKSAIAYLDNSSYILNIMQQDNPLINKKTGEKKTRHIEKLCSGQALLCKSLGLTIAEWSGKQFDINKFFIKNIGYEPEEVMVAERLGIAIGRDEHLKLRFIDKKFNSLCTKKVSLK